MKLFKFKHEENQTLQELLKEEENESLKKLFLGFIEGEYEEEM